VLTSTSARPVHAAGRPARRTAALFAGAAIGLAVLAGCSNDNVDCGLDQCTVTLDRSVDASANVLGVEAKFIGADGNKVTVEVAGEQVSLSIGQQAVQVAGLNVSLASVTPEDIKLTIAR
jgi:hypothetical protein